MKHLIDADAKKHSVVVAGELFSLVDVCLLQCSDTSALKEYNSSTRKNVIAINMKFNKQFVNKILQKAALIVLSCERVGARIAGYCVRAVLYVS